MKNATEFITNPLSLNAVINLGFYFISRCARKEVSPKEMRDPRGGRDKNIININSTRNREIIRQYPTAFAFDRPLFPFIAFLSFCSYFVTR